MTTALDPIRYVVYASHLSSDDSVDADAYGRDLATALRRLYPDREVTVEVRHRVSGVGSGLQGEPDGVDHDAVEHLADEVATTGICSEPGCGRIRGTARGLCPTHYQQAYRDRQKKRARPLRPIRTEPAAARIGVRLSAAALSALGERPAERAREVLEAWARAQR